MLKLVTKIRNWTNTSSYYALVLSIILYWFLVALAVVDIHGPIRFFTTRTNSMSPLIDSGNLVLVQKQPQYSYNIGDIISFYAQENGKEIIVTHRIVQIGGNVYITKGDANKAIDTFIVKPRLVIGKVIMIVPFIGYILNFSKTIYGSVVTIFIPLLFILLSEFYKIYLILKSNPRSLLN